MKGETPETGTDDLRAERARVGKANRDKGARRERELVAWLRLNGFPGAERGVRTGYRTAKRTSQDAGDITGLLGLAVQVTDRDDIHQDAVLWSRLDDTEKQRRAARAEYGLLVTVRRGASSPGDWWCHLPADALAHIVGVHDGLAPERSGFPVRARLADVIAELRRGGYGDPAVTG